MGAEYGTEEWVRRYLEKRRQLFIRSKARLKKLPNNDMRDQILDLIYYSSYPRPIDPLEVIDMFIDVFKEDEYLVTKAKEIRNRVE